MRVNDHIRLALAELDYYRKQLEECGDRCYIDEGWLRNHLLQLKIGELEVRLNELRSMRDAR